MKFQEQIVGNTLYIKPLRPVRVFVMSDIHSPFEDPVAMSLAKRLHKEITPDITIINGDFTDCVGISFFPKHPKRRALFAEEIEEDRRRLEKIRAWGNGRWVYIEGNHEAWMTKFLWKKAIELSDLLSIKHLLKTDQLGITFLEHCYEPKNRDEFTAPQVKLGNYLYVAHGDGFSRAVNLINVARTLFLNLGKPIMVGHWHQNQVYIKTDYEGNASGAWVIGCLCMPRPHYDHGKFFGQGVALVQLVNGFFEVEPIPFFQKEGRLYALWRGERYFEKLSKKGW